MNATEMWRFLRRLWLTLLPAQRFRIRREPPTGPRHDNAWRLSSRAPWPEYPGPHVCGACGWTTCPDCMKAGMDCGVCRHVTDPFLHDLLTEAWEKDEAFRHVDEP